MKKILILSILSIFSLPSFAQSQSNLQNFMMAWQYVDQAGNIVDPPELCGGETIYLLNTSTCGAYPSNPNHPTNPTFRYSIGGSLTTGEYKIRANSNVGPLLATIPAGDWTASINDIYALTIPVDVEITKIYIQHFGPGASQIPTNIWGSPTSKLLSQSITVHDVTADAGADIDVCHNVGTLLTGSGNGNPNGLTWSQSGGSSNLANPGQVWFMNFGSSSITQSYTLTNTQTYQTSNGTLTCTDTDDKTITINVGPQTVSQNYSLCDNEPLPTLYGGGPAQFEWRYTPFGVLDYEVVGTSQNLTNLEGFGEYTLISTGNNGCTSVSTHIIELNSSAGSILNPSFNNFGTHTATTSQYTVNSPISGIHQWFLYLVDGTGNVISTVDASGSTSAQSYSFVSVPKGSYYKIVHKVKQAPCNQWAETFGVYFQSGFIIYPNPVSEYQDFSVKLGNETPPGSIVIIDMSSGQMVYNEEINSETTITTSLPSSIYSVILMVENDEIMSKTLIVN